MDEENKKTEQSSEENLKKIEEGDSLDVDFVPEEEESNPQAVIKKLREKLKSCEKEKQEYLQGWQRLKADFVNVKKQEVAERESFIKFSEENIVRAIIPTLQNFDLAMTSQTWQEMPLNIRQGIEQVRAQLLETLKSRGLTVIDPIGKAFNPVEHQSTSTITVESEKEDHMVVQVVQKGYKLNEKVIEPAKVVISEFNRT